LGEKWPKILGYFCDEKNMAKVNNLNFAQSGHPVLLQGVSVAYVTINGIHGFLCLLVNSIQRHADVCILVDCPKIMDLLTSA
jgi:hypothetical protein